MPMPTRVLVVEDNADTRASLRLLLEDAAYPVIEAADGVEALAVLHSTPAGLVVLFDYRMPRMDGAELLARAKRAGWLADRHHTFVCLTATPRLLPAALSSLLVRHGVPVVGRPFDLDDLIAAIAQAEQRLAAAPLSISIPLPLPRAAPVRLADSRHTEHAEPHEGPRPIRTDSAPLICVACAAPSGCRCASFPRGAPPAACAASVVTDHPVRTSPWACCFLSQRDAVATHIWGATLLQL